MDDTLDHVKLDGKTLFLIAVIAFGALVTALATVSVWYLHTKFEGVYTHLDDRFEGMDKYLEARFESVQSDIQEIKEGQRQLIGYMKDHEGRLSRVEVELKKLQPLAS